MVFCHDNKLPTIEFLIVEIDDLVMTAVVFPQENGGSLRLCGNGEGEQTMGREMVSLQESIPSPDFLAFLDALAVQHIGELLKVSTTMMFWALEKDRTAEVNQPGRPHSH